MAADRSAGSMVRLTARGRAAMAKGGFPLGKIGDDHVLKIETELPKKIYGRKAYAVSCGDRTTVLWACHIRNVRKKT